MRSNMTRLNKVIPGSARHTARIQIMEDIIEEIAQDEKLAQEACRGFRRVERAIYYLNPLDHLTIELNRQQLATKAHCSFYTLEKDLSAINRLFDAIGLRLQHWDSGGVRTVNGIEETTPSLYYWPSPGGRIIEQANEKIELAISSHIIGARDEQGERRIINEMIAKEISDPNMQQLMKDRAAKKIVRDAKRADRADDKAREKAEQKVVQFPAAKQLTPKEAVAQSLLTWRGYGINREDAHRLLDECWPAE